MKNKNLFICVIFFSLCFARTGYGESEYTVFDDKMLIEGYAQKYAEEPKNILLERIKDDELTPYMSAAAVRVFREKFSREVFAGEKNAIVKMLLRRLNRSDSNLVTIELMHTLCVMDRYKYFESMIPELILLLDHYNTTVNELAYNSIDDTLKAGHNRAREARIVFNTIRKTLFLTRKKYANIKEPGVKLKQKLEFLRWAIKILGNQELKRLPPEIIDFL